MENIYMLSDTEIIRRLSAKIKELRLKQNITRKDLADSADVSLSSIVRMESGEIRTFESFLRVLRTLGKLDIISTLMEEEPISPNAYYQLVNSAKANERKRASRHGNNQDNKEETTW